MQSEYFNHLSKNKRLLLSITCIGVFSALSYIGVLIHIPIPSPLGKPMIHLGNLIVIVASLIFGGWIGGISGAIGMGLYDLIAGYDIWSITRTIILKLVMGLIVGFIYHRLIKKEKCNIAILSILVGLFFLVVGILFLSLALKYQGVWVNETLNKKSNIYWPIYTFSIMIGIVLIISGALSSKLPFVLRCVTLATSVAIMVNLCGEFIYKVLKQFTLGGTNFTNSLQLALLSVPSTLLNGVITIILAICIFIPIRLSLNTNKEKEID